MRQANSNAPFDARAYLDALIMHGVKLGLNNIRTLLAGCGDPQSAYPIVHVGGTNGKGSVVAFLAAMLHRAGYRVGRFTSPHLLDVTERFIVDGLPMSATELDASVTALRHIADSMHSPPTYFEMNTAIALRHFAERAVDIALVEVGMGGRFDATNVVHPLACAITNIELDHTQYLGDTRAKIAFEKAGILKTGTPAVIGVVGNEAWEVIAKQARHAGATLHRAHHDFSYTCAGDAWTPLLTYSGSGQELHSLPLGLAGAHQADNAAVAVTLAGLLRPQFPALDDDAIRCGLAEARWPGRMERVLDAPPVIMDVAHNPAGCAMVCRTFKQCVTVFAASSDKDIASMLELLAPMSRPLLLTVYDGGRSSSIERLRACVGAHPHRFHEHLADAIEEGMHLASQSLPLLITGSIYAAGEARRLLVERYGAQPPLF